MQYSTALSDAVLALACLASLLWLRPAFAGQPVLRALLLGFGLTATAALCGAVRYGLDPNWIDKHRSFSQLSAVLGLPLLGLAALALARGLAWGRSVWTVCLLVLVGLFIGARVLGIDPGYRLALSLATLLLILYAGLSRWPQRLPGLAALRPVDWVVQADPIGCATLLLQVRPDALGCDAATAASLPAGLKSALLPGEGAR